MSGRSRTLIMVARGHAGRLARRTVRLAAAAATAKPVMRSRAGGRLWAVTVAVPGLPDSIRTKVARTAAAGMTRADRADRGTLILRAAADRLRRPESRTWLAADAMNHELTACPTASYPGEMVTDLLALADARYRHGDHQAAAASLNRAMTLAFHRSLHIDQVTSPLAADPTGFIAPFRRSAAMAAARAPRGRGTPPAPAPTGRPLRLLIATTGNDNFLRLIREHYDNHPDVQARFLDFAADPELRKLTWASLPVLGHRLTGRSGYGDRLERRLRPELDWADVLFIDWCVAPAAMVSLLDPGSTRIIVRLHSYEALTRWPHLVDFSRVDDLVFVASHIQDLSTALLDELAGPTGPATHLLENAMPLSDFQRDKKPEARFRLGMVGIGQVVKDPRWAIEVLRQLRVHDPRYQLLLVGGEINPDTSAAARAYHAGLCRDLAELEPSGAVRRCGPTNDVPRALTDIGVILSTSVREGSHCGLMEGAASGAAPVVRDWPFFAGRANGARTLYPADWVVGTVAEAVDRIRSVTRTAEDWREAGRFAQRHALTTWDFTTVRRSFDRLILGG